MAKEEKKEKDAAPLGDAESSPRQDKEGSSSNERGEDTASPKAEDTASPKAEDTASPKAEDTASPKAEDTEPPKPAPSSEPDWKDLYARLRADFDNFKKRTARDREDTYRYAEADILKDVLPVVDNLALALANAAPLGDAESSPRQDKDAAPLGDAESSPRQDKDDTSSAFVKGVQLVYDALLKSLKDHGAEPFDSVGLDLDTEKMEAIATLPSATVAEGKVSNEVKRGWMLKGKVLRVAQVVVSSGKGQ